MCLACRKQLKMSIYYHCNCHFHNFAQNRLSLAFLESRAFLRMDGWGGNHDTVSGVFRNTDSVHRWRKGTLEKLGNSDEVTLLARGRAEFTLQVLHILVLISFLLSFHFTLYITVVEVFIRSLQNTIIGSSGNFSAFCTYVEATTNLPVGKILAKFMQSTAPGTQLYNGEFGVCIALKLELS